MHRREFIAGLASVASAVASSTVVRAQPGKRVRRVGVLMGAAATEAVPQSYLAAFLQGLRGAGWIEGKNVEVIVRWNAGDPTLARIYAAQLLGFMPDVILAHATLNLTAVREATSTVPVVFTSVSDPVEQGFVANLTKPGGNLTGFTAFEFSIGGKWLGLLKEIAPGVARVGVMFNPETSPQSKFFMRSIEAGALFLGIQVGAIPIRAIADLEPAIESFARQSNGALLLTTDTFLRLHTQTIADTAIRQRLPSLSANQDYATAGGLMYYSVASDNANRFRAAADYVARILNGEKPGDLPIQNPTKYELVINRKTARTLGIQVPLTLLAQADEVIE